MWLALLKHGRLLVLKDGIHQFMFQPGAVTEFRKQAHSFAAAADWGSFTVAGTGAVQGCVGGEATSSGAAAKTEGDGAADEVTVSVLRSVGIVVVVESMLAQFKPAKKQQAQESKDGGPRISAGRDSAVAS